VSQKIGLFVVLLGLWLLITWVGDTTQIVVGVIVSLLLTLLLSRIYEPGTDKIFNPVRWFWFLIYLIYFLFHCLKANLDVAYRVLNINMPIRPAIVKVHTRLNSSIAKAFLANSITLTPGTLTVDMIDDAMYIHWINVTTDDPAQQQNIIVTRLENILWRVFE